MCLYIFFFSCRLGCQEEPKEDRRSDVRAPHTIHSTPPADYIKPANPQVQRGDNNHNRRERRRPADVANTTRPARRRARSRGTLAGHDARCLTLSGGRRQETEARRAHGGGWYGGIDRYRARRTVTHMVVAWPFSCPCMSKDTYYGCLVVSCFLLLRSLPGVQEKRHTTSLGKEMQPAVRDVPTAVARRAGGLLVGVQA